MLPKPSSLFIDTVNKRKALIMNHIDERKKMTKIYSFNNINFDYFISSGDCIKIASNKEIDRSTLPPGFLMYYLYFNDINNKWEAYSEKNENVYGKFFGTIILSDVTILEMSGFIKGYIKDFMNKASFYKNFLNIKLQYVNINGIRIPYIEEAVFNIPNEIYSLTMHIQDDEWVIENDVMPRADSISIDTENTEIILLGSKMALKSITKMKAKNIIFELDD